MNDRQRLEAIVSVVCKYLPPDGISKDQAMTEIISLVDPLPEQEQGEPVAWMDKNKFEHLKKNNAVLTTVTSWSAFDDDVPLYTTPQKRKPLTDEQIDNITAQRLKWQVSDLVRAIEAAHGIKE